MVPLERIDVDERLFVLKSGDGFSCLGFDVVRDRTRQFADLLEQHLLEPIPYGTVEALKLYNELERSLASSHIAKTRTIYDANTPDGLVNVLENVRLANRRIRLFYGDRETGLDWNEAFEIEGYISRTCGPLHCAILVERKSSRGGGIILSAWIVKLVDTAARKVLWEHPSYHCLRLAIVDTPATRSENWRLPVQVLRAGKLHARFATRVAAERFISKMTGA